MRVVTNLWSRCKRWFKLFEMRQELAALRYAKLICDWRDYDSICERLDELTKQYHEMGGKYE